MPGLSQPRVVATSAGKVSCGMTAPSISLRLRPKIWPTWKVSLPEPPSSVVIVLLSSTKKKSLPPRPKTLSRPFRASS